MAKKLRVLVIAEACNPEWTSVPLVGYNVAHALASRNDLEVTLATHPRNRPEIEADEISKLATVIYPDNEYIAGLVFRLAKRIRGGTGKGWTTNTAFKWLSYVFFERELYKLVGDQLKQGEFDLIHRVTPVSPTMPSPISRKTNVPMLIGPLNGGLPWPNEFPQLRQQEKEFLVPLRKSYKLLPFYKATYKNIRGVIAGSRHTSTEIPKYFQGRRYVMPENGVDPRRFTLADGWTPPDGRFRFITIGRLVPYKGLWLTLTAMRDSPKLRQCDLYVVGDGPERENLQKMVNDFGLAQRVRFLGWVDQVELAREMSQAQAFVFPSLREFGGGVVLEAMSSGLPSIIVDYGGPAELLDERSGILLPMTDEANLISSLRSSMERLLDDPKQCRTFGSTAVQRVRIEFTWESKAAQLKRIYNDILGLEKCAAKAKQEQTSQVELATSASTS